jgi:hypothetical protein
MLVDDRFTSSYDYALQTLKDGRYDLWREYDEILARRPGQFDDIEPFLRVVVARLVIAQCRAEHLELALVPAAHE